LLKAVREQPLAREEIEARKRDRQPICQEEKREQAGRKG